MYRILERILDKEDWLLRVAVSFPILWVGIKGILHPLDWVGFVPPFVSEYMDPEVFLVGHGFVWIVTAAGILAGFWRPFFSAVAFLGITSILIFFGVDDITFRDVGLAITAFVLFLREVT